MIESARCHYMSSFLTESKTMTEAASVENKIFPDAPDLKTRTLYQVPAEHAPYDNFEIPAANLFLAFARKQEHVSAKR